MKIRIYFFVLIASFAWSGKLPAQVKSIRFGNQVWMAGNLDVNVQGSWYFNEDPENGRQYGRLYSWEAAKKACPAGWHLPSDDEWTELINYLGGEDIAGKQLKITGASGFNAPLAGYADGHSYWFLNVYGGYWSSTIFDETHAWYRYFTKKDNSFTKTYFSKNYGFSVRCVKD